MLERKPSSAFREMLESVAVALVLAFLIRTFVVQTFYVSGVSMENTLQNQERLLVNRLSLRFETLHYGDIVVFQPPMPGQGDYIKRVVATGGQTVSMVAGQVYVNGRKMPQPFLHRSGVSTQDNYSMAPLRVPQGDIFVLGDHRDDSTDSRIFGPVSVRAVQGVAFFIIWPLSDFGPITQ